MGGGTAEPKGPDLKAGVRLEEIGADGLLSGHADGEAVLLYRSGEGVYAVGGTCTHYSGPLAEGVEEGGVIRCPWHHACFSLRTGEALAAPGLNPLPRWRTEVEDGVVRVVSKEEGRRGAARGSASGPEPVVIVGAGAAGSAAAEQLRWEGYGGRIVLIDGEADAPYDRPNLSKDYLAGKAPEEWLPVRTVEFYERHGIERRVARVKSVDVSSRTVELSSGGTVDYGSLLLATGAKPVKPRVSGVDGGHVHVLRSLSDCRRLIEAASGAGRVLIAGASFIGMEAAASLRARGVDVVVVAPERVPFERTLGAELGGLLRSAHEGNGVEFRLGRTPGAIREGEVELDDGTVLAADVVLLGVGVRPDVELASSAGLETADGVVVNEYLETSAAGVYAAGDIALYPDPRAGRRVRVEHWVVAQRQGQTAARNILGQRERYVSVPFFWTNQFDVFLRYVGWAGEWDEVDVSGSVEARDCAVRYLVDGRVAAVATVGRDRENLEAELALEEATPGGAGVAGGARGVG